MLTSFRSLVVFLSAGWLFCVPFRVSCDELGLTLDWFEWAGGASDSVSDSFEATGVLFALTPIRMKGEEFIIEPISIFFPAGANPLIPSLSIRAAGNALSISWNPAAEEYVLEESSQLFDRAEWKIVSEEAAREYNFSPGQTAAFFRLRRR